MSYDFNGTTKFLSLPDDSIFDLGIGGSSFTIGLWIKWTSVSARCFGRGGGLNGWTSASTSHQYVSYISSNTLYLQWFQNTGFSSLSVSAPSAGSWAHIAYTYNGTNLRGYKSGSDFGNTNTTFYKPTSSNITVIGQVASYALEPPQGESSVADFGIWSAALNASEIASLAKGMTCDKTRPQSLVFYAPLVRNLIDAKGGLTITNNNSATVANHPRIYG